MRDRPLDSAPREEITCVRFTAARAAGVYRRRRLTVLTASGDVGDPDSRSPSVRAGPDRMAAGRPVRRRGPDHRAARHASGRTPERAPDSCSPRASRSSRSARWSAPPSSEVDQDPADPRGGGGPPARPFVLVVAGLAVGLGVYASAIERHRRLGRRPRDGRLFLGSHPRPHRDLRAPLNRMMGRASRSLLEESLELLAALYCLAMPRRPEPRPRRSRAPRPRTWP